MRSFPLLLLLVLLPAGTAPSRASAATVTVEPADTTVTLGATVRLRIVASPFAGLKGYHLVHSFDPAVLALAGEQAGDVLTGTGRDFAAFPVPDVAAPVDSAALDGAMLDGTTSGPGVLAYLEFTANAAGDSPVVCAYAEFRDAANVATVPDCVGGVVHVTGPVPVRRPTWGALKSIYRH
jgi:hypothetical protein